MPPKSVKTKTKKAAAEAPLRYYESNGSRKTSVARVRLYTKKSGIAVNGKDLKQYFTDAGLQKEVLSPLESMNVTDKLGATVKVSGGGLHSQATAIANGLARALLLFNPEFRKRLRKSGLLTRDPRMVERKKYGLKKARRAPQWAKR